MINQNVRLRNAVEEDIRDLVSLSQIGFKKSPEWRSPFFVVRRWWYGVVTHPKIHVLVAVKEIASREVIIGYCVGTTEFELWETKMRQGPHSKISKILVMFLSPSIGKAFLQRRIRVKKVRSGNIQSTNKSELNYEVGSLPQININEKIHKLGGLYLALMVVDPKFRGEGLAKRLLVSFEELAIRDEVGILWGRVESRNKNLQSLYLHLGYEFPGWFGSSLLLYKQI